jgi:hypothetical protein
MKRSLVSLTVAVYTPVQMARKSGSRLEMQNPKREMTFAGRRNDVL